MFYLNVVGYKDAKLDAIGYDNLTFYLNVVGYKDITITCGNPHKRGFI